MSETDKKDDVTNAEENGVVVTGGIYDAICSTDRGYTKSGGACRPLTQTECVSGYYCHMANHITNETHRWRKRPGPIRWQETYHITNETYRMAKETYHMAKEIYHMAKET